ncbi:hypothetical protein MRO55_24615, partial [Escherichia coli]|uniref:hypothetical protein n=1 Tax=Escherichia coli TaxID=562 RepID=UPI002115AE6C
AEWTLEPAGHGTRLDFMFETEPALPTDRFVEAFGYRGWMRRKANKGLKRLRGILEDNEGRGVRATVGGL